MVSLKLVFLLLIAFQVKHFIADYSLQNRYMLGKFKPGWSFVLPLLAHVSVHGVSTLCIAFCTGASAPTALGCMLLDMGAHFVMDRIKADPKLLGRFKPLTATTAPTATPREWKSNDYFWYALGFDQMFHHLTHYLIIYILVTT